MGGGRRTALGLIIAILAVNLLIDGRLQGTWAALWGPIQPLGGTGAAKSPAGPAGNISPGIAGGWAATV